MKDLSIWIDIIVVALCAFSVFSTRVQTGFFVSAGYGLFAIAAIADLDPTIDDQRLLTVVLAGAVCVVVANLMRAFGIDTIVPRALRNAHPQHQHRRATDA
jgi:hypothetical protein